MTTEHLSVMPGVLRISGVQVGPWENNALWRRGPDTPDGFWMVYGFGDSRGNNPALRVIIDNRAPVRTYTELWAEMDALARPGAAARKASEEAAQDAYLAALTIAAEIPPAELVRLRDAVRAGRVGGHADGRRVRKPRAA